MVIQCLLHSNGDIHLFGTYEAIFKSLKKTYGNLTFKYGSKVLPAEENSLRIAEFINRNKQLYEIFVEGIESSDIFIADITNHNPNVMLELGIAMKLNKNVLILKAKDSKEKSPFNIQSVQINEYASVVELEKIIFEFIEMYSRIRNQTFDNYLQERYTKIDKIILDSTKFIRLAKEIRNLRIRFKYNFVNYVNKMDWLGVHLRTQGLDRGNSELIDARVNGELELLSWPSYKPSIKANSINPSGNNFFEISLIENIIDAKTNSKTLEPSEAFANEYGTIVLGTQAHTPEKGLENNKLIVECTDFEIINLDTTAPI